MKTATLNNNKIKLKFWSNDSIEFYSTLEAVKQINGRRFDPATKCWTIPLAVPSVEAIKKLNFDIASDILSFISEQSEKIKQVEKEISEINFSDSILYDYQIEHAKPIIHSLLLHNTAIDSSDTGTGKTYIALAIAKHLNLMPVIITPKSVISSWHKAAQKFGINIFCLNYEQFRTGKTEWLSHKLTEDKKDIFTWHTDDKHLIIFDEAHRCKSEKTLNSKMLRAIKKTKSKCMALSATIADNPLHLLSLGYVLDMWSDYNEFWRWAYTRGVRRGHWGVEFKSSQEILQKIHSDLFPKYGHRIKIKELGDKFPDNLIICDTYNMNSNEKKIQTIYESMHSELSRLYQTKEQDKGTSILTEILRARQEIELLKVPTIVEMAADLIEEGNSVAIFVNFKETISALSEKLKTKCIIDGSITGEHRDANIDAFQSDKERIILCNIKAGGVGISLHDLNGNYPRVSLISPTNSAIDLVQSLGRIHRAGAQSKAIQKIIFCANTIEEEISKKVASKIDNIKIINDGDLQESMLEKFKQQGE